MSQTQDAQPPSAMVAPGETPTQMEETIEEFPPEFQGAVEEMAKLDTPAFLAKLKEVAQKGNELLEHAKAEPSGGGGGDNELVQMLKEGSTKGVARASALGQRMMRQLSPEEKELYKKVQGQSAKAEWRQKWAAARYEEVVQSKLSEESWDVSDTSVGTYISYARMCVLEGGDSEAHEAARRYCMRCCMLGGSWISFNEMTGRHDYLHIQRGRREIVSKK